MGFRLLITDLMIDDPSRNDECLRYELPDILDAYGGPVHSFEELPVVLGCLTNNVAIFSAFFDQATTSPDSVTIPMSAIAYGQDGIPGIWPLKITAYLDSEL
jgi:hypothetical protein